MINRRQVHDQHHAEVEDQRELQDRQWPDLAHHHTRTPGGASRTGRRALQWDGCPLRTLQLGQTRHPARGLLAVALRQMRWRAGGRRRCGAGAEAYASPPAGAGAFCGASAGVGCSIVCPNSLGGFLRVRPREGKHPPRRSGSERARSGEQGPCMERGQPGHDRRRQDPRRYRHVLDHQQRARAQDRALSREYAA